MKWYDDVRDELVIIGVVGITTLAMLKGAGEIAGVGLGALAAFLKRGVRGNGSGEEIEDAKTN